jgi:diketogulonate reductase-like aldo/keto reductase
VSRHSFDPAIAAQVGLNAAVIYQNLYWWCDENAATGQNIHEGMAWTYASIDSLQILFPYLTFDQVRRSLRKLKETGLIRFSNFNTDRLDRTRCYCVSALPASGVPVK